MHRIPKTAAQLRYLQSLQDQTKSIVLGTGPAGTGKTMFACQVAVDNLSNKLCQKIILTRPVVAVDEELGFLPGDIEDKMNPWSRPMFEVLDTYYSPSKIRQLIKDRVIEVSPLGFMRGRTLTDSFIIADEMQNSTVNQMKMLLTRIGENSKMVITGDTKQCDLENENGLDDIIKRIGLERLVYLDHVQLSEEDIQRHKAVQEILRLYTNGK
jgi:phosphate starvation-inducible PhoH-like protein